MSLLILSTLIMLSLLSALCWAQEPLKIGVSLGLTGRFAVMSDALNKGLQLWEHDVNKGGGLLGRKIRVIVRDDQGDPQRAGNLYKQLIEEDRVHFLFGPYSSLITEAVLPIAERHEIPILIAGAAADRLWNMGYRNAIGIYTPASKFTVGFLELIVRRGLDGIAVLYARDSFSKDVADGAMEWGKRFRLRTRMCEGFEKGLKSLDALAGKARELNSQVLMVCGHMEEALDTVKALKRLGWRPGAFYASVGPAMQAFYDQCGASAEGVFGTSLWEPRANYPGAQKFEKDFKDTFGSVPGYHAGLAYAGGQVLAQALKQTGSVDRGKVREALFEMDTMTIIGRFGVDNTGKQVRQHTFIVQWQDGRKELVWPKEIQTAEPRF